MTWVRNRPHQFDEKTIWRTENIATCQKVPLGFFSFLFFRMDYSCISILANKQKGSTCTKRHRILQYYSFCKGLYTYTIGCISSMLNMALPSPLPTGSSSQPDVQTKYDWHGLSLTSKALPLNCNLKSCYPKGRNIQSHIFTVTWS